MNHPEEHLVQSFISMGLPNPLPRTPFQIQCRICLQGVQDSSDSTISPCNCAGSIGNVHFRCLSEWIGKHHKVALVDTPPVDYFPCEMCKLKISFETEKQLECLSFRQCANNCRHKKALLVILLLMSLSFLAIFVFGIIKVVNSKVLTLEGSGWFESLLILSALLIVLTVQLFSTYLLLAKFLVGKTARIVKIGVEGKGRNRSHSTCTSEANLLTADHKIRNSQLAHIDLVLEDMPE